MTNAVKRYFDERMRELAIRQAEGDENVLGCLMGYTSQNPKLSNWMVERFEHYCREAKESSLRTGAPM